VSSPSDLYGWYAHLYDGGRAEEFAELFTADGVFTVAVREPVRGRAAIAEAARQGIVALPGVRHLVSSIAVAVSADGATAAGRAYVQAVQVGETFMRLITLGCYTDRFVLETDRWLIADHHYEPFTGAELRGAALTLPTQEGTAT
jgi:SnoaL-like polyketide cyclase.